MTANDTGATAKEPRPLGHEIEPIRLTVAGVDPDHMLLVDVRTVGPQLSIAEASRILGKTPHWMRWREENGHFGAVEKVEGPDGKPHNRVTDPEGREVGSWTEKGARRYGLGDIEAMVHALLSRTPQGLSGEEAASVLSTVYSMARTHKFLPASPDTSIPEAE